jgi:hypothetical protein
MGGSTRPEGYNVVILQGPATPEMVSATALVVTIT